MENHNLDLAEFILNDGSKIQVYHSADVYDMIKNFEMCLKDETPFCLAEWGEQIEEVYLNDSLLMTTNYSIPLQKIILYKFEG